MDSTPGWIGLIQKSHLGPFGFRIRRTCVSRGDSELVMRPEPYHWDEMKIGPGAPTIRAAEQGWLSIYH